MNITIHWQDADSSSALAVGEHYPNAKLMLCGGHAARAHLKTLKNLKTKRTFVLPDYIRFSCYSLNASALSCWSPIASASVAASQ